MQTKIITASLLSLVMSVASAAEVAGTVNSKGNLQVVRSGVSQSVNNSSAIYMINDQLVTSKKATASLLLKDGKPQLSLLPETKLAVSRAAPLGVELKSGMFSANFKPAQTISINTPDSFVSAKATSAGELVAISEGGKLALTAKSGSFTVTDASGITRTLTANQKALLIGQGKSEFVDVVSLSAFFASLAANPAYLAAAIAAAAASGIVITAATVQATNNESEPPASPALNP